MRCDALEDKANNKTNLLYVISYNRNCYAKGLVDSRCAVTACSV